MGYSVFSQESFAGAIRAGDSQRFSVDLKADRQKIIESALAEVNSEPKLEPFAVAMVRGKECVSYLRYIDHLILRIVSRHLLRRLRLTLPSRDKIIKGVIESLMDATPMYVLRRDITSFYESIPIAALRDRLLYDTASSEKVRRVLRRYFEQHCSSSPNGIPRGIGLSAVLAEMAMREFDRRVREVPGVYKYYRFSDDIVIFCFERLNEIETDIASLVPVGLNFSTLKSVNVQLDEIASTVSEREFEYLGYSFRIQNQVGGKSARTIGVSIATKKISRMKTRTILTLKDFEKTKDFSLLIDRLRFISCNYRVRRNAMAKVGGPTHVRSGIFYNYRFCGVYNGTNRATVRSEPSSVELRKLDGFYHSLRRGSGSSFASSIGALSADRRAMLARISFLQGFSKRLTVRFTPDRVHRIQAAWRNV
jgi:hypothetical protein